MYYKYYSQTLGLCPAAHYRGIRSMSDPKKDNLFDILLFLGAGVTQLEIIWNKNLDFFPDSAFFRIFFFNVLTHIPENQTS